MGGAQAAGRRDSMGSGPEPDESGRSTLGPNNSEPESVNSGDGLERFEDLYRRRGDDALRYATAIVGANDARDAVQDAWLRAWRAWGKADPDRIDAWLFRIVRNCCIDQQRARKPVEPLEDIELPAVIGLDDAVTDRVDAEAVLPLLERLSVPLREVLWLREVVELSYAEIAELQDVPIGTVMSRLHAARKKAASLLRKEGR